MVANFGVAAMKLSIFMYRLLDGIVRIISIVPIYYQYIIETFSFIDDCIITGEFLLQNV